MWFTDDSETQVAEWDSDVSLAITQVDFRYYIWISGVQYFLQADMVTFAVTDHTFSGTQAGLEWSHTINVPRAAYLYNMEWSATPNVIGDDFTIGEKHFVNTREIGFNHDGFVFNGIL